MTRSAKRTTVAAYASAAARELERAMLAGAMCEEISPAEHQRVTAQLRELWRLVRALRRKGRA